MAKRIEMVVCDCGGNMGQCYSSKPYDSITQHAQTIAFYCPGCNKTEYGGWDSHNFHVFIGNLDAPGFRDYLSRWTGEVDLNRAWRDFSKQGNTNKDS